MWIQLQRTGYHTYEVILAHNPEQPIKFTYVVELDYVYKAQIFSPIKIERKPWCVEYTFDCKAPVGVCQIVQTASEVWMRVV